MANEALEQIHGIIQDLKEDRSIPRNVVSKLESMESIFSGAGDDIYIKVDKALQAIEEIIDDTNLQPFIRTRLWNISSLLESI
jgi:uncharacterized protein (UPF0147 family)